ncbi:MAG: orotate phosphoribosyltransferase, partial [Betaproteobacteria bacterium]|nr:orotate phosphoribosyltransferase [Betaproteobacteria bacterium]
QVLAVAQLYDLLAFLQNSADSALAEHLPAVQAYRQRYGVI